MSKSPAIFIDTAGPANLREYYANLADADIEYCEDVLGEFPATGAEAAAIIGGTAPARTPVRKAGDAGWQEIGYQRAIGRWEGVARQIKASGEFGAADIVKAESALSAYRNTGKPVPAFLSQFLGLGEVVPADREMAAGRLADLDCDGPITEDPSTWPADR